MRCLQILSVLLALALCRSSSGDDLILHSIVACGGIPDGPIPTVRIKPDYPPDACESGTEGYVIVAYTINESGGTKDIEVIEASPKGVFEEAAIKAVREWKYRTDVASRFDPSQLRVEFKIEFRLFWCEEE